MFHWRVAAIVLVVLALSLLASPAKAHDAGTYTVILKAGGPEPANTPHLEENITVLWINTDNNTENVTHRILLDADGDGVYNGSADIDSGELQGECEKNDNGTLVDEDCHMSFELTFNGTLSNGTFAYQDRLSDSTIYHGNVTVERHADGGDEDNAHVHDDTHAHDDEEPATESDRPVWLLWVAGFSAGGAVLLGALLMRQGGSG